MRCGWGRFVTGVLVAVVTGLGALGVSAVRADGEAGLVIHYGDGRVETYCIGFTGDSIDGASLLARAGKSVNDFSGLVCGIDGVGCTHSGTFASCNCECQTSGAGCTYWAFFTQPYGTSWRYSSLGFRAQAAGDGDLHAWKWGEGGPSSAPAPPATSFESICGHAPRGGVAPPTSTSVPVVTLAPPTTAPSGPGATQASGPTAMATEGGFTPAPDGDLTVSPSAVTSATREVSPSPVVVGVGTMAPANPDIEAPEDGGGGGGGLIAFGVVAVVLVGAIGGAVAWRARNGEGGEA